MAAKTPPSPQSPAYDRAKAVNFVLDVTLEDIRRGCPPDTFLVGDILDRLDDELLDELAKVTTGPDLEQFLAPHGDPAKIEAVKKAGEEPKCKSWLTRVVVTAQDEYRRSLEEANKK